jgi:hypothetical protein
MHRALDAVLEWNEADHPRKANGQFGSGGGSGEIRGHVDRGGSYTVVPLGERVNYIAKELRCGKVAAKKYAEAADFYSGPGYVDVRRGEAPDQASRLQDYVDKAPKWDGNGPLYRGLGLSRDDLAALSPGSTLDMNGVNSWSSDSGVAVGFARRQGGRTVRVMLQVDKGDTATSIAHLSQSPSEDEVLFSGKTRFEVVSIEQKKLKRSYDKGRAPLVHVVKVREVVDEG